MSSPAYDPQRFESVEPPTLGLDSFAEAALEWRAENPLNEKRGNGTHPRADDAPGAQRGGKPTSSLRFKMFAEIESAPRKLYIVDGLLGEGEMSAIAGAPGSGKSVLAGDLSCHLAAGLDWMGRRIRKPLGVLYVAAERAKLTERRFAAWRRRHHLDDLPLAIVAGSVDFLNSHQHVDEVLAFGEQLTKATRIPLGLVVVDTVSRALAGGDENSPMGMGAFVANVGALMNASGAHVLCIHHVPQGGDTRLRGHGALLGAVDTLLTIEKAAETRVATVTKDNDSAEGVKIAFRLESVDLSIDEEGFVTTAPVVVAEDAALHSAPPNRIPKPKKLPPAAAVALKAFDKTMAETGEAAPASNHIPASAKVVTLDRWREYAAHMNISTGEDRAQRLAFSRALDRLSADGLISTWESYAWRTNTP